MTWRFSNSKTIFAFLFARSKSIPQPFLFSNILKYVCRYPVYRSMCHRAHERKTKVNYSLGYGLLERKYRAAPAPREFKSKRRTTRTVLSLPPADRDPGSDVPRTVHYAAAADQHGRRPRLFREQKGDRAHLQGGGPEAVPRPEGGRASSL